MRIINYVTILYIISVLKYNLCIIIKGMLSYIYNFLFPELKAKDEKEKENNDDDNYIIIRGGQYQVNEADLKSVILSPPKKHKEFEPKLHNQISEKDLQSVVLLPPKKRKENKVDKKVNIQDLSRSQLKQIMNVKLKPVKRNEKKKIYGQRHPVLKELQEKVTKK